jgi:hypothetical protein
MKLAVAAAPTLGVPEDAFSPGRARDLAGPPPRVLDDSSNRLRDSDDSPQAGGDGIKRVER